MTLFDSFFFKLSTVQIISKDIATYVSDHAQKAETFFCPNEVEFLKQQFHL